MLVFSGVLVAPVCRMLPICLFAHYASVASGLTLWWSRRDDPIDLEFEVVLDTLLWDYCRLKP